MKRRIKRLLVWIPFSILILVMGFLGFIIFTESGFQWIFERAVQMAPGKFSAEKVQGRLIGPIELQGIIFSDDSIFVSIKSLKLEWAPLDLVLLKNLKVSRVLLDGVRVETFRMDKQATLSAQTGEFKIPFGLVLEHGLVTDISLVQFDNPDPVIVNEIFLKAQMDRNKLNLENVRIKAPMGELDIQGTLSTHDDFPMNFKVNWTVQLEKDLFLEGGGGLEGSLRKLVISQAVRSPFKAALSVNLFDLMGEARWEGSGGVEKFSLQKVNVQWPEVLLTGTFQTEGTLSHYGFRGSIQGFDPSYVGDFAVDFLGNQDQGKWQLDKLLINLPEGKTTLNMKGKWNSQYPQESFMLEGSWDSLVWPILGDDAEFQSPQGGFKIRGSFKDYQIQVGTSVRYGKIPISNWEVSGNGNLQHLSFVILSAKILEGEIRGKGKLKWNPRVEWEISLSGKGLNPGEIYPEWPGKIDLAGSARGFQDSQQRQFKIDLRSIKGDLRGRPIGGKTHLEIIGDQYVLSEMMLQSGTVHLSASGTLTDRWDVSWNIDAKTLGDILPEGGGSLKGIGEITGFRNSPRITTLLDGEKLKFGFYGVQDVVLDTLIDTGDTEEFRISFVGKGITWGLNEIEGFSFKARGKMESHELSLDVTSPKDSIRVSSKGTYQKDRWVGLISNAEFATQYFGNWFLQNSVKTHVSLKKAGTSDFCFVNERSRICLEIHWEDTAGFHSAVQISKFPLSLLKSLIPHGWELEGTLNGRTEALYRDGIVQNGNAEWRISKGRLSLDVGQGEHIEAVFEDFLINGIIKENAFLLNTDILLNKGDSLKGSFDIHSLFPFRTPSKNP